MAALTPFMSSPIAAAAPLLVVARRRTLEEGKDLIEAFAPIREAMASEAAEITLSPAEGETINGLHFPGTIPAAILFLHGNGCFYETAFSWPYSWREELQKACHLVVFNPRGVGKSTGETHPDTVAEDCLAAFQYLVESHGVDPNRVVIIGHSLGGFFGAFGAKKIQDHYPEAQIHFISDRSFADIHSRIADSHELHELITKARWDQDPIEAIRHLKGRVDVLYHRNDAIIPFETSLYFHLLKASPSIRCHSFALLDAEKEKSQKAHNRAWNEQELCLMLSEIKLMLGLA